MKCENCGHPSLLIESLPEGKKKVSCPKCGLSEVRDEQGRKLLLDAGSRGDVLLS